MDANGRGWMRIEWMDVSRMKGEGNARARGEEREEQMDADEMTDAVGCGWMRIEWIYWMGVDGNGAKIGRKQHMDADEMMDAERMQIEWMDVSRMKGEENARACGKERR